jgi:hypothetical protein
MFKKRNKIDALGIHHEYDGTDEFLAQVYLKEEYIVPEPVDRALRDAADTLQSMPGFVGVVNVGGTANGSLALRLAAGRHTATDLDFYLVGSTDLDLAVASDVVRKEMAKVGIGIDGELNGKYRDNYLNLDEIDTLIDRGDAALLALPFQSFYGRDKSEAQRKILDAIIARSDAQDVWDEVSNFHAQSLSLHHGSFPLDFSQHILDDYYPTKVETYGLPITPQQAYGILLAQESN